MKAILFLAFIASGTFDDKAWVERIEFSSLAACQKEQARLSAEIKYPLRRAYCVEVR